MKKVAVLGGGAAGMMASISAARAGAQVTIFEKSDRLGRKLLATGNGRCNISNRNLLLHPGDFSAYHGTAFDHIPAVFHRFGLPELENLFLSLGIPFRSEGERLYPYNLQASSVQDALRYEISRTSTVEVRLSEPVKRILPARNGIRIETETGIQHFDTAVLTTGGQASPQLGSAGEGFALLRSLDILITPPVPSLVKLKLDMPYCKRLSGLRLEAGISVINQDILERYEQEEVIFTDDGISGTAVFQVSGTACRLLQKKGSPVLVIDQFPEWSMEELVRNLRDLMDQVSYKNMQDALNGLVHKKMIPVLLKETGVDPGRRAATLKQGEIRRIASFLKQWKVPVNGHGGFRNAQVTAGGVCGEALDANLQLYHVPHLYCAGEVVDVDGDCGGYNLQWAFSSGWVCGEEAARGENKR